MPFQFIENVSGDNNAEENLEGEIELKKGIQTIVDFIDLDFEEKFLFGIVDTVGRTKEIKEAFKQDEEAYYRQCEEVLKKRFKNKFSFEIKEMLGEETIILIEKAVSMYNKGIEGIRAQSIEEQEDIHKLVKKQMIPMRLRQILQLPESILAYLMYLDLEKCTGHKESQEQLQENIKRTKGKFEKIEKDISPEKKEPIQIKRFEKFDFPQATGKEFVKQALQFLPQELLGKNIKAIEYDNKVVPMLKESGIMARYNDSERKIMVLTFRPAVSKFDPFILENVLKKQFLQNLLSIIICEGGYSLDPRFISQEKLSVLEETQMIIDWEKIRTREKKFSDYAGKINTEDKIIEDKIASEKDFSGTVMLFLTNPEKLKYSCPTRFEFCKKWFNKQFPEENFTETKQFGDYLFYPRATKLNRQYNELLEKLQTL